SRKDHQPIFRGGGLKRSLAAWRRSEKYMFASTIPPRKGSAMTEFYPRPPAEQMKNSCKAPRILRAFPATPCFRSPLSEESPSGLCFGCAQKAVGESLMLNFQRSRRAFWFVAFAVIIGA